MSRLLKSLIAVTSLPLAACASSVPSNFMYETSLRGEQGIPGRATRLKSAAILLEGAAVMDPLVSLQTALPDTEVKVKRWGLRYFGSDWSRYQVVLDADITRDETKTRCREASTEKPVGAPTLEELQAENGKEFVRLMEGLIADCAAKTKRVTLKG